MVVIYTSAGCASCRKAKQWLKDHNIEFIEKNIFNTLLDENELKYLIKRCDNGTDDIISKRSVVMMKSNIDLEALSLKELIRFIQHNPSVLKRPIIINERNMLIGYDDEEISAFLPIEVRRNLMNKCTDDCPNYSVCGVIREEV